MKNIAIIATLAAIILFVSCDKGENTPAPTRNGIRLAYTNMGGCNNGLKSLLVDDVPNVDTLIYSFSGDSLKVYVGINYICGAPFRTECKIENGAVKIYIKDVCDWPKENCYSKCMCYYTFDFIFTNCDKKSYPYIIYLIDQKVGNMKEIYTGVFTQELPNKHSS